MQTQNFNNKFFFHSEESKNKDSMSTPSYDYMVELIKKKDKYNRKKKLWEYKQKYIEEQKTNLGH